MFKILIDPGHGGQDIGASFHGLHEKDVNLAVCLASFNRLQFSNWVALIRTNDVYIPLYERVAMANNWRADIFISIHVNADPDEDLIDMPQAKGEEIWIYPGSVGGRKLAEALKSHVDNFFPEHGFRGIKESSSFAVLRKTKMPAILVEIGFIDNLNEHDDLKDPIMISRIGHLIGTGIRDYKK